MAKNLYTITGGPLRAHEYVVVKREMSAADEAWITNHGAHMGGTQKKPEMQLTIGDVKLATLKRMIVSWHLTEEGDDGRQELIPLSDKAIEELPRRISAFLNRVIDELNPDEEESSEDFTHGANGSSGGNSDPAKMPQLKD